MNKMKSPHIDVIIVNYNGLSYMKGCLDSLLASDYSDFSVIVVDNDSSDGSVQWVRENYPGVTLIENSSNEGFGRANSRGIKKSSAEFFALLNNDTEVDPKWLGELAAVMEKNQECAAACSKLVFMDNPEVLNAAGGGMNFVGYGYDHNIFSIASSSKEEKDVFFPTAAACLIRRSAFDDIGGFDSSFFMYHEDVDLGWRFNLRGYSVKYVPLSVVRHAFGGTSLKSGSMLFRNRLGLRHALRSLIKNYEIKTLKKVLPIFCRLSINNFLAGIPTGFFRALFWNFCMLPGTIIERYRTQRRRRMSDFQLSRLIWQDVHLPVQFPDYRIQNLKSFSSMVLSGEQVQVSEDTIDIFDPSSPNLGYGWHCREIYFGDGHTPYRWTRSEAKLFFMASGKKKELELKVLALSSMLGRERALTVSIFDRAEYRFVIKSDGWEDIKLPLECDKEIVEINLQVSDTWSPDAKFGNSDYRELGIGIASVLIR